MAVRVVIDVSEEELEKMTKSDSLAFAFVNAVYSLKKKMPLEEGTTISTATNINCDGHVSVNGVNICDYDFSYGYGRYKDDQGSVIIRGENGSSGEVYVQKAPSTEPIIK